jgi:hypothetical protein
MNHKLQFVVTFLFFTISFASSFPQAIPQDSLFLGQTPPGTSPKIFELPVSNGLRAVERIAITSDNKEIYYSELNTYPPTEERVKCFKYLDNKWQGPFIVFEGYMAPALSVNDSVMYVQKNLNNNSDPCTYFSIRNDSGWSTPVRLLSTGLRTHYFQETTLKNFYVSSILPSSPGNSDICMLITHNSDTTIQSFGMPVSASTTENDFFIARDESYIIVCRTYSGSASDLYISYKNNNGNWANPKIMGSPISTPNPNWEYGPYVTKDNKYLFFTRGGNEMSSYNIYWVNIDKMIDSLKHTNFLPYVKSGITNQTDTAGHPFSFSLPDTTFIDDDGNNTLSYTAKLSNGSSLPSWLTFNPETKTFSGTPTAAGAFNIKVTVTDTANANVSSTFILTIASPTGVEENKNQLPKESQLFQSYPNPFNPTTTIKYFLAKPSLAKLTIYNMLGQKIRILQNTFQTAGEYSFVWDGTDDGNNKVSSGVYFYRLQADNLNIQKKMIYEK